MERSGQKGCSPLEGVHEDADVEAPEVLRERDHAEGVQAQAQRVALHALVVLRQVAQVRHIRLHEQIGCYTRSIRIVYRALCCWLGILQLCTFQTYGSMKAAKIASQER